MKVKIKSTLHPRYKSRWDGLLNPIGHALCVISGFGFSGLLAAMIEIIALYMQFEEEVVREYAGYVFLASVFPIMFLTRYLLRKIPIFSHKDFDL